MYSNLFNFEERLKQAFSKMDPASILIVDANPTSNRTGDQDYYYRPNSYLVYLIGFEEPNCHLVLTKDDNGGCQTLLFVQPRDPEKETWTGKIIGPENAKKQYKVTDAFKNSEFEEWYRKNVLKYRKLYYSFGSNSPLDQLIINIFNHGIRTKNPEGPGVSIIEKSTVILNPLRVIKDEKEIEIMKKACEISAKAHIQAMKFIKPTVKEYEIENVVNSYFRGQGGEGPAYSSICATGDNATVLHYITNRDECKDGELFLLDAAAEYKYYSSDITRTFPVNGKFTDLQKKIYEIVLKAEKESIKACVVGNTNKKINDQTIKILTEGLVELGILSGDVSKLIEEKKYEPFYMHGVGHYLGLDTHDVGPRKVMEDKKFIDKKYEPGMITTIEPGLYFSSKLDIPTEFKGIGVRIEDDILITENGPVVLSDGVPKEIFEIEELMAPKK